MLRALFCAFLPLLLTSLGASAQTREEVPRPEVKVGDSWTYRDTGTWDAGTHETEIRVTFVDGKSIVGIATRKSDGKEYDSIWTPDWNAVSTHTGMNFRPHGGVLRFPLSVGNSHRAFYEAERVRDGRGVTRVSMTVAVIGWETVEVPAGKFRALRIEATHDGRFEPQVIVWYAPEVKRPVRTRSTGVRSNVESVLIAYKLN